MPFERVPADDSITVPAPGWFQTRGPHPLENT